MNDPFVWLVVVAIGAFILWLLSRAIFSTYFRMKEEFVERLVHKQKGTLK